MIWPRWDFRICFEAGPDQLATLATGRSETHGWHGGLDMNELNSPAVDASDRVLTGRTPVEWGSWVLLVLALAAVGAVSYLAGAVAPVAVFTLPPVAMLVFGFLAGGVQAFAWRRQYPPVSQWVLASSLAGLAAALVSVVSTSPAQTSAGLLAGWAYAWAAYGSVFGLVIQRLSARRWLLPAGLLGWATAGITSGAVGWALDVFQVTETVPTTAFLDLPSRSWSMTGLGVMGAVCGATGAAITGAALALVSRAPVPPQDGGEARAKERRLVRIAGAASGLLSAVLCTYLAPLVITVLLEGSLESVDLTYYPFSALYSTPVCLPTIAIVSIPLAIAGGHLGLEIGRACGRPGSRLLVWCGTAIGGVAGYVLGSLVAFSFIHLVE